MARIQILELPEGGASPAWCRRCPVPDHLIPAVLRDAVQRHDDQEQRARLFFAHAARQAEADTCPSELPIVEEDAAP